jgi:hypothetical protein
MQTRRLTRCHGPIAAAAVAIALLLFDRRACAQDLEDPAARQGYWIGVGYNQGGALIWEDGRKNGFYRGGGPFILRAGEQLSSRFGLGLVIEYAALERDQDKGGFGVVAMEGTYRIWRHLAANVGAGFGYGMLRDDATKDKKLRGSAGAAILLGAGYDFFVWRRRTSGGWAVSPTIDVRYMNEDFQVLACIASLKATYWTGRRPHQLRIEE